MHNIKKGLNIRIRLLIATNACVLIAGAMVGPIYALFVEHAGGNILDAGLSYAVFAVVSGLVMIISGRYSDKMKQEKLLMLAGYLILAIAFFLYTKVENITSLLLVQALLGLGQAIYYPAYDSLYSQNLDRGHYGFEWGLDEAKGFFSEAIGASLGGFIAYRFGFDTLFLIMSLLTLFAMVYALIEFKTK